MSNPTSPMSTETLAPPTARRPGPGGRNRRDARTLIRVAGSAMLAVAALAVLFGMAPKHAVTTSDIEYVMTGDRVNQDSADSAPKQTVVNGWTTRDLLELIAKAEVDNTDARPAALLTIAVLALCLGLATGPTARPEQQPSASASPHGASPPQPTDLP